MDTQRKTWNKRQTEFREMLLSFEHPRDALKMFMEQHAMVHSAGMTQTGGPSFEDEVLNDMTGEQMRRIPQGSEHSVAWLIWHMARIEDVAMNLLVAGEPQIFSRDKWFERLSTGYRNTGNAMEEADVASLSATVDLAELRAYRRTVGRRTREIGVRVALGAKRGHVVALVLNQAIIDFTIGTVIGVVSALALSRIMSSLLYGVTPTDPIAFMTIGSKLLPTEIACIVPLSTSLRNRLPNATGSAFSLQKTPSPT